MPAIENKAKVSMGSELFKNSAAASRHAVKTIQESSLAPYVTNLYLYGSCARKKQQYGSDVDLFLVLCDDIDAKKFSQEVIRLKGAVTPEDPKLPEVDLKVVVGNKWRSNNLPYYKNILKEGVDLWNMK